MPYVPKPTCISCGKPSDLIAAFYPNATGQWLCRPCYARMKEDLMTARAEEDAEGRAILAAMRQRLLGYAVVVAEVPDKPDGSKPALLVDEVHGTAVSQEQKVSEEK